MFKILVELKYPPFMRNANRGKPSCEFHFEGMRYTASGRVAESLVEEMREGGIIEVTGRYESFKWKDIDGHPHERLDFSVQAWERIA